LPIIDHVKANGYLLVEIRDESDSDLVVSIAAFSKVEALKEIIRAWGMNPEHILAREALAEVATTPRIQADFENHQFTILSEQLKQLIRQEMAV